MKSITNSFLSNETSNVPQASVTVLYEDLEAGLRARSLLECVESSMDLPAQFKVDLWRFDWFGERSLRSVALNMARSSALIVVSTTTDNLLPPAMERWLDLWIEGRQEHPGALLVLLSKKGNHRARGHMLLRERLQEAARRKQMGFCYEVVDSTEAETDTAALRRAGREEGISPAVLAGARPGAARPREFTAALS